MNTVRIEVSKLLAHLMKNREAHKIEYAEAMDGYRDAVIKALSDKLKKARKEEDVDHSIKVVRPTDYTDSYDEAIAMLEWTTEKEVEIDRQQFKQYVQDEWVWKQAFAATSALYKGV